MDVDFVELDFPAGKKGVHTGDYIEQRLPPTNSFFDLYSSF